MAAAAVAFAVCTWLSLSENSIPPAPRGATDRSAINPPLAQLRGAEMAQRLPVLHAITWTIVDDRGQAVVGATSTVGSASFFSDGQGVTSMDTEAIQLSVIATAPSHTTVEATVTLQGDNLVTLQRVLPLTVRALDAIDRPVPDVEVRIARIGVSSPAQAADTGSRTARTGANGLAVFHDVPPGTWLFDAGHDNLVYSRDGQIGGRGGYEGVVVAMPQEQVVMLRMLEPYVFAVEVDAGDILSCGIHARGAAMHQPSNPSGQASLQEKRERLQAAHPKAAIFVSLQSYPPTGPENMEVQASVWAVGRRPWQGRLQPVLLRDFLSPTRIALSDMQESSDFGSVLIHIVGASGGALTNVPMQLLAADLKDPPVPVGQMPFSCEKAVVEGQLVTLPAGSWRLRLANPFLQRCADKLGVVHIDSGSFQEIRVGSDLEWALCRLCSDDDAPDAAGTFTVTHLDSGATVTQMVNDIRKGVEMWIPVGLTRLEIAARQLGLAPERVKMLDGMAEGMVKPSMASVQRLSARVVIRAPLK
jgi:hypothetical protein